MARKRITNKPKRPSTGATLSEWLEYEKRLKQYVEDREKKKEIQKRIASFRKQQRV